MEHLKGTMNQNRGVPHQRESIQPTSHANLMERIFSQENMLAAWKQVKANKGAPGIDGMTILEFPEFAKANWVKIRSALLEDRYTPSPARRVEIPKPTGGTRPLGIPIVLDRLIEQAIAQVLSPIFDPMFSAHSFGFRPNRSAHQAVKQVKEIISKGRRIGIDCDLSKFFDRVNHDILMNRLTRRIKDKRVLRLIGKYLRSGVMIDEKIQPTLEGVPQGSPLSPLLANIVLDDLDKELEKRKHTFARYADDFIILVKSKRAGERVMQSITRFLTKKLKLAVNADKSKVAEISQCKFLGFVFVGKQIRWSEPAFREFKRRVREITGRSWGISMEERLQKLAAYLRGWMNYFGISEYYRPLPDIDGWIRRRLRMCYWKQWRRPRTKIKNLLKLGVWLDNAIKAGMSSKSYWRLSKTLATQSGMTNEWFAKQGLVSVREIWIAIHYPR
jgi:RNA-directed DNA polymerase